tara:strand:- start:973 stop:1449 length:477 start_codon:yes stop_codon:yes gene_type:complete
VKIIKRLKISLILFIFLTGCSPRQNKNLEIVLPPTYPKEYSDIPNKTKDPELKQLIEPDRFVESIKVGRDDPFLPAQNNSNQLYLPESFDYLGQIYTNKKLGAFVNFLNNSGTIYIGEIGGVDTNLLPDGWLVESIDNKNETLTLSFKESKVTLSIFK